CVASRAQARGQKTTGSARQVGPTPATATARRMVAGQMARRNRLHLRTPAQGALEGSHLSVAGLRPRGAGQGGGCRSRRILGALSSGQFGVALERFANGGIVCGALSARRWFPRSEATAGLGGMSRLDGIADQAYDAGVVRSHEP